MTSVMRKPTTFIVRLASAKAAQACTPLILKYPADNKHFFDGEAVPEAMEQYIAEDGARYVFAGIVLETQPAQPLAVLGFAVVAVCVRGGCTALLARPEDRPADTGADTLAQTAPGDRYVYGNVHCGTIVKRCNTVYQYTGTGERLVYIFGLVFVTEFGLIPAE